MAVEKRDTLGKNLFLEPIALPRMLSNWPGLLYVSLCELLLATFLQFLRESHRQIEPQSTSGAVYQNQKETLTSLC